jgi:hypothetical protein
MGKAASPVDICNLTLDLVKEAPITNFETPSTATESLCKRNYDNVRRAVLRKHAWNFASKRVLLPKLTETPAFEYEQAFQCPNDFVRLLSVGEDGQFKDYVLENYKILANGAAEPLPIRYIYDFTVVNKMDALFVEIFSIEFAIRLGFKLTGSESIVEDLKRYLREIAPNAYAVDGQESPPKRIETSRYLRARGGNTRDTRYFRG